jgi:hypothetical protein
MTNALDKQVAGDHYKNLTIQPVEFIHANGIGFFEGNVIKYVSRWRQKNGIADLEKAKHYIELLIELESRKDAGEKMPADEKGWIKWYGGKCPVPPETLVNIMQRDGEWQIDRAVLIEWDICGMNSDVMFYRVVKENPNA